MTNPKAYLKILLLQKPCTSFVILNNVLFVLAFEFVIECPPTATDGTAGSQDAYAATNPELINTSATIWQHTRILSDYLLRNITKYAPEDPGVLLTPLLPQPIDGEREGGSLLLQFESISHFFSMSRMKDQAAS